MKMRSHRPEAAYLAVAAALLAAFSRPCVGLRLGAHSPVLLRQVHRRQALVRAVASAEERQRPTQARSSVFTGRWVDPDLPADMRTPPSLFTVIGSTIHSIDELFWNRQWNVTRVRKETIRFLSSLDQGDFRWEFLTPWRKEPLSRTDKFIVCVTFVGLAIVSQELWDRDASLFEHLAYIVFFFSYAIGNNLSLRVLAILGSALEIAADILDSTSSPGQKVVPATYESIFIIINAYYAIRAFVQKQPVDFAPVEAKVYEACFKPCGLTPNHFLKILQFAEWHVAVKDESICEQGMPVRDVFVPLSGNFTIISAGKRVGSVPPLRLIGEVSLLENLQSDDGAYHRDAIASMVAESGATYVRWPQSCFYGLMKSDEEFAAAMQLMISKALSQKLMRLWEGPQQLVPSLAPPPGPREGPGPVATEATAEG